MTQAAITPVSLHLSRTDPAAFASALGADFERWGFAIVCDHGIDAALIARAWKATQDFFALPADIKASYHVPGGAGQRGYTPFKSEHAKDSRQGDLKEFWHTGRDPCSQYPARAPNLIPTQVPTWQDDIHGLYEALDLAGKAILQGVARHLTLAPDWFDAKVAKGESILRLLHYPPIEGAPDGVRAAAHGDINVITLLLGAEEAGLELLDRDGSWRAVCPPEGALVVNIGDMLERLTNARLPSTIHRVVNPPPERAHLPRYSMPFFLHFAPDVLIEALPECLEGQAARWPPISARDFLLERLRDIGLVKG